MNSCVAFTLVCVALIVQLVVQQVDGSLGSLKQAIASTGIGRQRSLITQEQHDSIRQLGAIWACDDELGSEELEILKQFDPGWAYDKMELKRLCALRLMSLLLAEQELARLTQLTKAQLELEEAQLESPLIDLGD